MKNEGKADFLVYIQLTLLVWFLGFVLCLWLEASQTLINAVRWCVPLVMLLNIPLAVLSLVFRAKGQISRGLGTVAIVVSVLNSLICVIVWAAFLLIVVLLHTAFGPRGYY